MAGERRHIPADAVESVWPAPDGWPIRRIDWKPPEPARGSVLFLPGLGDYYEKYLDTLSFWAGKGWRVTASDWRGQAGSGRMTDDPHMIHVDDFAIWLGDLAALWRDWVEQTPAPHVLVGHSMGGHLVLRALLEQWVRPDAVVISAPMLGFHPQKLAGLPMPGWMTPCVSWLMVRLSPRGPVWTVADKPDGSPGHKLFVTHDPTREEDERQWWAARPFLRPGSPSWSWLAAALASMRAVQRSGAATTTPLLALLADEDQVVDSAVAARLLGAGRSNVFGPSVAHEILRETEPVRALALAAIDEFLDRAAPSPTDQTPI